MKYYYFETVKHTRPDFLSMFSVDHIYNEMGTVLKKPSQKDDGDRLGVVLFCKDDANRFCREAAEANVGIVEKRPKITWVRGRHYADLVKYKDGVYSKHHNTFDPYLKESNEFIVQKGSDNWWSYGNVYTCDKTYREMELLVQEEDNKDGGIYFNLGGLSVVTIDDKGCVTEQGFYEFQE